MATTYDSERYYSDTLLDLQPFHLIPDGRLDGRLPDGKQIGSHVFYFFDRGSMGVGQVHEEDTNLKGKTLEFYFIGPGYTTYSDVPKIDELDETKTLMTLRIL